MPRSHKILIGLLSAAIVATLIPLVSQAAGRGGGWDARAEALKPTIEKLRPLHKPLAPPQPGDWLAEHKEAGQTFRQYVIQRPIQPTKERGIIYILPIGVFTEDQRKVVKLTAEYMAIFFSLPVKMMEPLASNKIPPGARRAHPVTGEQFLSTYILSQVLKPRLPKDGCVILGLTATDLWAGTGTLSSVRRRFANGSGSGPSIARVIHRVPKRSFANASCAPSRRRCMKPATCSASITAPRTNA